ncbi:MAG: HAD family hydrolase [Bdellovibrionota bacterium]|mgnify:FL=1
MKLTILKTSAMALALSFSFSALAQSDLTNAVGLQTVIDRAKELTSQGRQSIVLFDLDDTLTSTQERKLRILKEFANQPQVQEKYSEEAKKILQLKESDIHYQVTDDLKNLGITNADLIQEVSKFWLERFFTNEYCSKDKAIPGSANYLHKLVRAGAKVVYLTGRDAPNMQLGTIANLKRNFFPNSSSNSSLFMKPELKMDDLVFKKEAFVKIAEMGEVIGVFENEPANINAMVEAFPKATAVFLDTIHSPKPDVPGPSVIRLKNYVNANNNGLACGRAFRQ